MVCIALRRLPRPSPEHGLWSWGRRVDQYSCGQFRREESVMDRAGRANRQLQALLRRLLDGEGVRAPTSNQLTRFLSNANRADSPADLNFTALLAKEENVDRAWLSVGKRVWQAKLDNFATQANDLGAVRDMIEHALTRSLALDQDRERGERWTRCAGFLDPDTLAPSSRMQVLIQAAPDGGGWRCRRFVSARGDLEYPVRRVVVAGHPTNTVERVSDAFCDKLVRRGLVELPCQVQTSAAHCWSTRERELGADLLTWTVPWRTLGDDLSTEVARLVQTHGILALGRWVHAVVVSADDVRHRPTLSGVDHLPATASAPRVATAALVHLFRR